MADLTLARVVQVINDKKELIKNLENEVAALYASLPQAAVIGDYPAGDFILQVQDNKAFDGAQAKKVLPAEIYESILVPTANTVLARRKLSGDQYAACQVSKGVKRTIKRVTDFDE